MRAGTAWKVADKDSAGWQGLRVCTALATPSLRRFQCCTSPQPPRAHVGGLRQQSRCARKRRPHARLVRRQPLPQVYVAAHFLHS